jgi:CTD nuclear envelope phosphatase 1
MTAGFVGVLGLWSDLWTVIFGPDEDDLVNGKDGRLTAQHEDRHKGKGREDEVSASSASETETEEKDRRGRRRGGRSVDDEMDGGWADPVTRAPDDPEELLQQAAEAEMLSSNGTSVATPEKSQPAGRRSSPQLVSFQLGKQKSDSTDQTQPSTLLNSDHPPSTSSILANSSNNARHTLPTLLPTIQSTHASGNTNILMETRRQPPADPSRHRNTKLLPAPLSVPLSATSASKRRDQLIRNTHNQHQPTLSITSIPRSLSTTPFHRPKTLILDLDETLIHSTSRPMSMQSSGIGGGSGMLGISLSGLFSGGKHQRGGGGARGEGHVVEVVLGGRSTLYHVYKRPYVDHFLKKVSRVLDCPVRMLMHVSGVFMVYPRYIHGEHARIRRSSH